MTCKGCTRRHFLKSGIAASCGLGFLQAGFPGYALSAALSPPEVRVNITARCLFCGLVATGENQASLPNPRKTDIRQMLNMNDDCSGTDQGIRAVMEGRADIGTAIRRLTDAEKAAGLAEIPLDTLAYSVIVNKKNPVDKLTSEQVLKIFAGRMQNWKEVGGNDAEILIFRQECGANYDGLLDRAMRKAGISGDMKRLSEAVMSVEITDNQLEKIAEQETAITFAPRTFFDATSKVLAVDGIFPTRKSEKDGSYAFCVPLMLVTRNQVPEHVRDFLAFVTGPQGRELMEKGIALDWLKQGF